MAGTGPTQTVRPGQYQLGSGRGQPVPVGAPTMQPLSVVNPYGPTPTGQPDVRMMMRGPVMNSMQTPNPNPREDAPSAPFDMLNDFPALGRTDGYVYIYNLRIQILTNINKYINVYVDRCR